MQAMKAVEAARGDRPFADIADFAARVDPRQINRMQIENLVRAGALDSLEPNRARAFAGADMILRRAQTTAEENESGQVALFATAGEPEKLRLPDVPDWTPMDRIGFEADAIGFHLTAHPLDAYAQVLRRMRAVTSNQLEASAQAGPARVRVAGSVIASKERTTRTGSRMAWIRLSDSGGSFEITVFSEVLAGARDLLTAGNSVLATVDLRMEGEALRITAHEIVALDKAAGEAGAGMRVWLERTEAVPHIRALLQREGRGKGRVVLIPRLDAAQDVEITLPGGFNVTPRLAQAMKVLPGVGRVEDL
jgi:DNA polymerase III subunit alpha